MSSLRLIMSSRRVVMSSERLIMSSRRLNLIKEKLLDLIEWTFYKKEGKLYLACNDKKAFFTSADHYYTYWVFVTATSYS